LQRYMQQHGDVELSALGMGEPLYQSFALLSDFDLGMYMVARGSPVRFRFYLFTLR